MLHAHPRNTLGSLLFAALLWGICFCGYAQTAKPSGEARITFEKTVHDFGRVMEGPNCEYGFVFKNTGGSPLIIRRCSTSDPHVADWPKEPIMPGKKGTIRVIMPTLGRAGIAAGSPFDKQVYVFSNAANATDGSVNGQSYLRIKGVVYPDSTSQGPGMMRQNN